MVPRAFGDIRQLGYVVADLDASVRAWSRQLGVGPWTVFRNVPLQAHFRGEASTPLIDVAMSYRGPMQIELIQQRNDAPSPYRAMIENRRYGLHHTAYLSEHIENDVRRALAAGFGLACDIRMPGGGRYAYLQSPALGEDIYVELLEATPQIVALYNSGMADAASWDGTGDPTVIDFSAITQTAT
jgi:hypothetical protein